MRTDPRPTSTPTDREAGRTWVGATIVGLVLALVILPDASTRFALLVGVVFGLAIMWGVWMADGAGRDTNRPQQSP